LRAHAVAQSLFGPTTLSRALAQLQFVQADPIRAPARAQDLILRQRVDGYRAGDLEQRYESLGIEEDLLYAYGFVARPLWKLLHPRRIRGMTALERRILAVVERRGRVHPGELEAEFGRKRVVNAWGGWSKQTTHALDHLHDRGALRIAGREAGVRVYQAAPRFEQSLGADERLRRLVMVVANLLSPVPERTLSRIAAKLRRYLHGSPSTHRAALRTLTDEGALERHTVDGVAYLMLPSGAPPEAPAQVRLLAPFDPVVWDRLRFEHLWGWAYRFEAYTPVKKRVRGYYALPLLWRDQVMGWGNASVVDGKLEVEVGFAGARPRERSFTRALDAEIARLAEFLGVSR
jgi:uncharacterized protein YcaQ